MSPAGTRNYPTTLDDAVALLDYGNNATTSLTADPGAAGTTLTVASTTGFPSSGALTVGSEIVYYSAKTATTFTGCVRGAESTTAAAHAAGVVVDAMITAGLMALLRDAVIALETKAGYGSSNQSPVASRVLGADGTGTSSWRQIAYGDIAAAAIGTGGSQVAAGNHTHAGVLARVKHSVNQSIANATLTALALDSERWDTDNLHDTATNNSRLTASATTAGLWLIGGVVQFAANATGQRAVQIRLDGGYPIAETRVNAAGSGVTTLSTMAVYRLANTDYVELCVYQSSGGALNAESNDPLAPEFWMCKLAP